MTRLPAQAVRAATARRLATPSWRDPRLLVGLLLVAASVALGTGVVGAAERTVGVYAVADAVGAGSTVEQGDLRVVQVRLDAGTESRYLRAGSAPPVPAVAMRSLSAGELLPRDAIGDPGRLRARAVSLPLPGRLPTGVRVGGQVDVWAAATDPTAGLAGATEVEPVQLVAGADVVSVDDGAGSLAADGSTVQVLVPVTALPEVLAALTRDARLEVVPVPGGPA
ncbi:hypothetical protein ACFFKU_04730 [Kineococcus gynurae]|uniref:SAF domain-containing protein n=1 Tax=Kineococcus gynurae TaxID=452979 RepID=A0ABV5LR82_9ACTN